MLTHGGVLGSRQWLKEETEGGQGAFPRLLKPDPTDDQAPSYLQVRPRKANKPYALVDSLDREDPRSVQS